MPPATFSPLAVTKSMSRSRRRSGQERLDGEPAGLADEVADHQDPADAPGRRVRVAAWPAGGGHARYLAYSTARVSRMTVTLIWPG